jgi:hypothetical protein
MTKAAATIENIPLWKLKIPGSHDSGMWDPEDKNGPDSPGLSWVPDFLHDSIVEPWSKSQRLDVYEQLTTGIRYLDIRLARYDLEKGIFAFGLKRTIPDCVASKTHYVYWTTHGLLGGKFINFLNRVKKFLAENPKEIVIMDINHLYGQDVGKDPAHDANALSAWIVSQPGIGDRMVPKSITPSSTVGEVWATGKNLVIIVDPKSDVTNDTHWPQGTWTAKTIDSQWPNAQSVSQLKEELPKLNPTPGKLRVTQIQITPDTSCIINNTLGTGGLLKLSGSNKTMIPFILRHKIPFNIVIADYVDEAFCCSIFECNGKNAIQRRNMSLVQEIQHIDAARSKRIVERVVAAKTKAKKGNGFRYGKGFK